MSRVVPRGLDGPDEITMDCVGKLDEGTHFVDCPAELDVIRHRDGRYELPESCGCCHTMFSPSGLDRIRELAEAEFDDDEPSEARLVGMAWRNL